MFVSEDGMKKISGVKLSRLATILAVSLLSFGLAQAASDDEKLRELERAMNAPSEAGMVKPKARTRAIVFDSQPQTSTESPASVPAVADGRDCARLPAEVKSIAVDFAIQFNAGSATVSSASQNTLDQIAKVLALSPDRCVIVEGHTDSTGNFDMNMELSRDRANSVVNFISSRNGIDRKRLVPVGKGPTDTLKNLDTRDPKNRRVVFKVVTG
ncbi:MAG: OmpA family protein [Rhodocyclaceae bacterium]|nr:OmpA family protein [Rhodocyclaceae bacterium]